MQWFAMKHLYDSNSVAEKLLIFFLSLLAKLQAALAFYLNLPSLYPLFTCIFGFHTERDKINESVFFFFFVE